VNTKIEFRRQLLQVAGYTESEVDAIDLEKLSNEEVHLKTRERLLKNSNGNGSRSLRQKVVPLDEVEKYIESGWEYVSQLPNGKAIIRGSGETTEPRLQINPAEKLVNS